METKQTTEQPKTTEQIAKSFIETSKAMRYQKQLETLFGKSIDGLMIDLKLSEGTRKEVFSGNTTDKKVIFGLVLSNVVLKKEASENFIKGLSQIEDEQDEI